MNLFRKVLAPAAVAAGFLVFLGAVGQGDVKSVQAAQGDICAIEGPFIEDVGTERGYMLVGETALVVARIENNTGDVQEFFAELDQEQGNSNITSIIRVSSDRYQYRTIRPVDEIARVPVLELTNAGRVDEEDADVEVIQEDDGLNPDIEDLLAALEDRFGYEPIGEVCGEDDVDKLIKDCIRDDDCDFGHNDWDWEDWWDESAPPGNNHDWERWFGRLFDDSDIKIADLVEAIDAVLAEGELECDDIAEEAGDYIINNTRLRFAGPVGAIEELIFDICSGELGDSWWDDFAIIDVTCVEAGPFDVTFWQEFRRDGASTGTQRSIQIDCRGEPDDAEVTVRPSKVEIIPAMGSVSHALITVELLDEDEAASGRAVAARGYEVDFSTNICSIEVAGVDTAEEFDAADTLFRAYNVSVPSSAAAIESSAAAMATVDSTRTQDTVQAFDVDDEDVIAAAILGCGPQDTGAAATPGTATITIRIEVEDGQDIVKTVTVTVVGPPADLKVTAAPSTLRCGEKATITATVKDSIGQNVSDHTRVEAVTNAGGVLGGTGAVAGQAGPVVPVASTVAETYDGVATFYLLTSDLHVGPYEVVVTTGGHGSVTDDLGGVFSTRAQVAQQTVTCTLPAAPAPAPAPTISAPRTGTGITPPSTGDAGLLTSESSSSSWTLFAVLGIVASVVGVASVKLVRR